MRYFWTLLRLELKANLRSAAFAATALFFIGLACLLSAVLPQSPAVSMRIGVLADGVLAQKTAEVLSANDDYEFVLYESHAALERGVLSGELHCGYALSDSSKPFALVLLTDGSYMHTLTDEIVLAAYMETKAPQMAQEYLEQAGLNAADAQRDFERLRTETTPMRLEIKNVGQAGTGTGGASSTMRPLAYAVLASVFVSASLLGALLTGKDKLNAQRHLAVFSGHSLVTVCAPVLAVTLLNLAVLSVADAVLSLSGVGGYPALNRIAAFALLGVFTAVFTAAVTRIKRWTAFLPVLIPPALLVSVLCSGAILDPSHLPFGLGLLRFLSPAWYFLRILGIS